MFAYICIGAEAKLKNKIMKKTKIETDEKNVFLNCPNCDNWEQKGIDDSRKNFDSLALIKWVESEKNEISVHKCENCFSEFSVEWDYKK